MQYVSKAVAERPEVFRTPLQEKVYETLDQLAIPFLRVDTNEAVSMDDCTEISEALGAPMVKTLFLCNRQRTAFFLLIMQGDKPFRSGKFSAALGAPHVSFAPLKLMESMLGTPRGAATFFSLLLDEKNEVRAAIDEDLLKEEALSFSDGTTTSYLRLSPKDVADRLLPYARHRPEFIRI